MSNEQNTQAGANFLTNDQIAAGAAIECDHGAPIGRNVAIDVFDAMRAAAPVAAQAGQVAPADDDLLEVARTLCSIAARRAELPDEKRKHYPHADEEGSPLLAVARAACLARGYTEDGLAVPGVTYPAPPAAGQVAVPEGWRLVPIKVTGLMREAGRVEADRRDCDADRSDVEMIFEVMADAAPSAPAVAQQAQAPRSATVGRERRTVEPGSGAGRVRARPGIYARWVPGRRCSMSIATGAALTADTFSDFVQRLRHHVRGAGVDWHSTADAMFTVQARRIIFGIDRDYTDKLAVYVDDSLYLSVLDYWRDQCESQRVRLHKLAQEQGGCGFLALAEHDQWDILADLPEHTVSGWDERWDVVNSHFTKEAAEAFIRRKKHDYRDGLRIYVEAQVYCWEFNTIINGLLNGQIVFKEQAA